MAIAGTITKQITEVTTDQLSRHYKGKGPYVAYEVAGNVGSSLRGIILLHKSEVDAATFTTITLA